MLHFYHDHRTLQATELNSAALTDPVCGMSVEVTTFYFGDNHVSI